MAPDIPAGMLEPVQEVIRLLVAERYDVLAEQSQFFAAEELRAWMRRWSAIPIAMPPRDGWDTVEAYPLEEPPPRWRVWVDLWDAEEHDIADLHAIVFVQEIAPGSYRAELKEVLP
jgi:hypothetical protein